MLASPEGFANPRTKEGSRGTTLVDGQPQTTGPKPFAPPAVRLAPMRQPPFANASVRSLRPVTGAPGAAYWASASSIAISPPLGIPPNRRERASARPAFNRTARKGNRKRAPCRVLPADETLLLRQSPARTESSSTHFIARVMLRLFDDRATLPARRGHMARPARYRGSITQTCPAIRARLQVSRLFDAEIAAKTISYCRNDKTPCVRWATSAFGCAGNMRPMVITPPFDTMARIENAGGGRRQQT